MGARPAPAEFSPLEPDHRFEYRDEHDNIIAEYDDVEAGNVVRRTLIENGYRTLLAYTDGKRALGSYGDVRIG
jgi:hypothetical protein